MTIALFNDDAYLTRCTAKVKAVTPDGVELDRTVFYPQGGGQPGDTGRLIVADGREIPVTDTRKDRGGILHIVTPDHGLTAGDELTAEIDWERRYAHMRMHTGLHLLGSLVPHGVTGGNISARKSRLDFDMDQSMDKDTLTQQLNALIAADHEVKTRWITDEELDAQPELVRTLSVQPPRGAGRVRLLEVVGVDLQPCGGTHVRRTGEIGPMRVSKIENKGRHNRRISVEFADP